jgi:Mce-associated membrane protein
MWNAHEDKGGDTSGSGLERVTDVLLDRHSDAASSLIGTDVGPGLVQAVRPASADDQATWAAILASASSMANAFLNVDYRSLDDTKQAVLALATGAFKEQYQKSFDALSKLTTRAHSVQKGEVVWAGISSVDDDSATVFIATNGTVINNTVDEPQSRPYRLQLEMALVDGEWLTRNLVFVEVSNDAPAADPSGDQTPGGQQ